MTTSIMITRTTNQTITMVITKILISTILAIFDVSISMQFTDLCFVFFFFFWFWFFFVFFFFVCFLCLVFLVWFLCFDFCGFGFFGD